MDAPTSLKHIPDWSLLAELATFASTTPLTIASVVPQLAALLERNLATSWGVLFAYHHGSTIRGDWGEAHAPGAVWGATNGEVLANDEMLALPLTVAQQTVGMLYLPKPSDAAPQAFYHVLVAQLALLLHAATALPPAPAEDTESSILLRELGLLEKLNRRVVIGAPPADLLPDIFTLLRSFFSFDRGTIVLFQNGGHNPAFVYTCDTSEDEQGVFSEQLLPADHPLRQHMTSGTVFSVDDNGQGRAVIAAPFVSSQQQVIGGMLVEQAPVGSFHQRDRSMLALIGMYLGLMISNGTLREQVEEQVLHLGLLNFVSLVIARTHDMQAVYNAILDTMVQVTRADHARLFMFTNSSGTAVVSAEFTPSTDSEVGTTYTIPTDGLVQHLHDTRTAHVANAPQHDPLLVGTGLVSPTRTVQQVAYVPLILDEDVLGIIELAISDTNDEGSFGNLQLEFCQTAAYQVASLIEKDRLFNQTQRSARELQLKVGELSTLLESAGILGSLLKPDEVIESLVDLVSRQLRVDSVALWTRQGENLLAPTALYGVQQGQQPYLKVGQGMTGRVAETGLPLRVDNIHEYRGEVSTGFLASNNDLNSYMGVPIIFQDEVVGVLSVMNAEHRKFSSDEMLLLVGLGSQAAIALQNARLFEERERRIAELTIINTISANVNATFELDELLITLHRGISDVLDTDHSVIGLYEEPRLDMADSIVRLRVIADGGPATLTTRTVSIDGRGLIDYVVLRGEPLLLPNSEAVQTHVTEWRLRPNDWEYDSSDLSLLAQPFESWLCVPIMQGDNLLGILSLQHAMPEQYTEDDVRFLATVAGQTAIAISNARLFSDRERRLRELTILKEIGSDITARFDLEPMLERLRYEMGQAVDVSTAMFALYDEVTDVLTPVVCYSQGRRITLDPVALTEDASGWVIRNRQPLLLHSAEQGRQVGFNDGGLSIFEVRSVYTQRVLAPQGAQSFLVVPILSGDNVLGVINLQSPRAYAFDQDDLRFVTTVANQLAATVANVHLFREREKRIEELLTFNDITRSLSAIGSFEDLPEMIYNQTSRLIDTQYFAIALADHEQSTITFPVYMQGGRRLQVPPFFERDKLSSSPFRVPRPPQGARHWALMMRLHRNVIETGKSVLVQGRDARGQNWISDFPLLWDEIGHQVTDTPQVWLGVPMIAADKVIGVLSVHSYVRDSFTPDDERLLSTIASSAGVVLENARLFEQISNLAADLERRVEERTAELAEANVSLQEEKERLETVHAITLELTSSLDLDDIISRALEMASTNVGVANGSIMLRDTQSGVLICRAVLEQQGVVKRTEIPIQFDTGLGLAEWVSVHNEAVSIPDVRLDSRWVQEPGRADNVRSVVAVPLRTNDNTLGVLTLTSPKINYFTDSQQRLLATVANEVAIVINNAQLYSYILDMSTRLADLLEQQKQETSKSQSIYQSMTEGVLVLDGDRRVAVFNPAAEHMLGIGARGVVDKPLTALGEQGETPEQRERARTVYAALSDGLATSAEREGIYSTSFEVRHPAQTIAINVSPVETRDHQIFGNVIVLRDITPEMEADRLQKEFFSKVSHELKTPLTAISGYAQVLQLTAVAQLTPDQMEQLTIIRRNAKNLSDLIEDILDLSRFEAGRIELRFSDVDVVEVIQSVVQDLQLQANAKHMTVHVDLQPDLPTIMADEKRIKQVVTNLLSNAIKYTFEGGTIQIRAFLNPANLLQVEVEDNGVGMSPAQQQKLFRPFYRADNPLKEVSGGTGLGLSIAKSLVELHEGDMWVISEQGSGSTFSFVLPLYQSSSHRLTTTGDTA